MGLHTKRGNKKYFFKFLFLKMVPFFAVAIMVVGTLFMTTGCVKGGGHKEDPEEAVNDTLPFTEIEFDEEYHDFGEVKVESVVSHNFHFKNIGKKPLKIYRVRSSCGCTTPAWTDNLIPPGGKGFIKVQFSAKGKSPGVNNKKSTVISNTKPKIHELKIRAEVIKDRNDPEEG